MRHRLVKTSIVGCLLSLIVGATTPLPAQDGWPTSIEVAVGPAVGWGGSYKERSGNALSFALTGRHYSTFTTVVTAGYAKMGGSGEDCVMTPGDLATCQDEFPNTYHGSLLFGTTLEIGMATIRLLGGPALFIGEEPNGVGPQAQADFAVGKSRMEFVAGFRASAMFRTHGPAKGLGTALIGLRVH
jgi:hypothetical protein